MSTPSNEGLIVAPIHDLMEIGAAMASVPQPGTGLREARPAGLAGGPVSCGRAGCGRPSGFLSAAGCERGRIGQAMGAAVEKTERLAMPLVRAAGWREFGAGAHGINAYGPWPWPC